MTKRRVVVTGIGAMTPLGNTAEESWEGILAHKCAIAPITHYDTSDMKVKNAAQLQDGAVESQFNAREIKKNDRCTLIGLIAANEAMKDAGFELGEDGKVNPAIVNTDRFGVLFSAGIGGLQTFDDACLRGASAGYDKIMPFFIPSTIINITAGRIAIEYGLHGACTSVVTACASGTNSIGEAFRQIRDGYLDRSLCGSTEASITRVGMGGFTSMHALSTEIDPARCSIPFDKERSGFVMGEGAGALVLEEYEAAIARGAKIYCEIVGYGTNCDAHHITAPCDDGSGAAKCMALALQDAQITPEKIDYINAHGTSTPLGDAGESQAVRKTFGNHANDILVSSTKSATGHLLGASGSVEAIFCIKALQSSTIPATLNYRVPDPVCDLNYVPNECVKKEISYALSNSLGFGGHNATIILKKFDQ